MGSLNSLGRSIFFAIAAIGLGWLADITSPRIALIGGQILGITSVWLTWKLLKLFPTTVEDFADDATEFTNKGI